MKQEYIYTGDELELFSNAINWKAYVAAQVNKYIKGAVAEVGAGTGSFTSFLYNDKVKSWTFIEPDKEHVTILQQKITQQFLPKATVIQGSLLAVPLQQKFDTILYMDVLEHIEDDEKEVATMIDHLHPGGYIIVLSPAFQYLYTPFDKAIGHFRRYNKKQIKKLFPQTDNIVCCKYLDSMGSLTSLSNKLFLKQQYPTLKQIEIWDKYILSLSKVVDPVFSRWFGRSVLLIWQKRKQQ